VGRRLLRRGFVLEYVSLGWNVAGIVVLAVAARSVESSARRRFPPSALAARRDLLNLREQPAQVTRPRHPPPEIGQQRRIKPRIQQAQPAGRLPPQAAPRRLRRLGLAGRGGRSGAEHPAR
jgi:hypothetical protein